MKRILIGSLVIAAVCCLLPRANAELSSADKEYLIQHQVSQEDTDIIPKLKPATQAKISAWIASQDETELIRFKVSRDYCRELYKTKLGEAVPEAPTTPIAWSVDYLTTEELHHFAEVSDKAPW